MSDYTPAQYISLPTAIDAVRQHIAGTYDEVALALAIDTLVDVARDRGVCNVIDWLEHNGYGNVAADIKKQRAIGKAIK